MKTLILIPARNEERAIGALLDRLEPLYPTTPVLVVNDASTDSTHKVVGEHPRVVLMDLPFWMGYGGALQAGYKFAVREGYDAVVQMDGDGQHDPVSIRDLLDALNSADVVVGSRFLNVEKRYSMSHTRRLGCHMLSWLARVLIGVRITDPTSGFQALSRKALELAVRDYYPLDYPDVDVLILMHRFRLKVTEIPVIMHPAMEKTGMHEGLQVLYYGLKMFLSTLVMMMRKV